MMGSNVTPRPCPFCGSEDVDPQLVTQERHEPYTVRTGCESCGSSGPESETLEGAVAAWNAAGDAIKALRAERDEALRERDTLIASWPFDGSRCVTFDGSRYVAGDDGPAFRTLGEAVRKAAGLDPGLSSTPEARPQASDNPPLPSPIALICPACRWVGSRQETATDSTNTGPAPLCPQCRAAGYRSELEDIPIFKMPPMEAR
jgi:Lar family restriction alleviation protein